MNSQFIEMLGILHRGYPLNYFWCSNPNDTKDKKSVWFQHPNAPAPLDGYNAYFGIYALKSDTTHTAHNRAKLENIAALNCLHCEYDTDSEDEKLAVLLRLEAMDTPPSVIIDSVGGLHCYWCFKETVVIPDGKLEHYRKALDGWVSLLGGDDNAKDLCRISACGFLVHRRRRRRMTASVEWSRPRLEWITLGTPVSWAARGWGCVRESAPYGSKKSQFNKE